ncbi:hypothetical protein DPMN_012905 [Dreissena polymorpha]|uniref:RRM domain-containing protein n=1 Tax=Dreissena polymorpha TaxID=45954 RepID=A0A9D4N6N7_DREPO|nr:hypothetical protein DPMN_012905 [Dreissena polymorpha]
MDGLNGELLKQDPSQKKHNYKLIIDPMIHRGGQKIYRFDGVDPADNTMISVKDPRPRYLRFWSKKYPADLPVPKFKFDEHYIGIPPPNEVTFINLNDNINKEFLEKMCEPFGKLEEAKIYYNPKNKKHMGIGKVVFTSSKAAKACAAKLHNTSKMGNIMEVFVDQLGTERQKIIDSLLEDKPKVTSMKPPSPKIDPRTGLPLDISSALHIDHETPVIPLHPQPPPPVFNAGIVDPLGLNLPLSKPPQIPFEQTPSDYSFSTNHSDQGYITTPGSGHFNSSNNQFGFGGPPPGGPPVNDPRRAGAIGNSRNHGFGNTPSVGSSYGNTPGTSIGNTPHSFDSGVPRTPITPQTPHDHMQQNDFDVNHEGRRGKNRRDRKDSFNSREGKNSYNNKRDTGNRDNSYNKRDNFNSYNSRDRNNKDNEYNKTRNSEWRNDRYGGREDRGDRNQRDWKSNREEWNKDQKNNRYNDRERDRNRTERSNGRSYSESEGSLPARNTPLDTPAVYPPPPPQEEELMAPITTQMFAAPPPKPPNPPTLIIPPPQVLLEPVQPSTLIQAALAPVEEEDTRSMSLDSRIQSLLSGFKSPEPAVPKTPPFAKQVAPNHSSMDAAISLYNQGIPQAVGSPDDDDRMSLDSTGSAGEPGAIEVHAVNTSLPPPLPTDFPNSNAQVTSWQQQNDLGKFNTGMPPGFMNNVPNGNFNQNFVNQFNNDINNKMYQPVDPKEEADKHEVTFSDVLENFVKELKEIMTKDLCKKMVEASAFKCYESWWDKEEEKTKIQKPSVEKFKPEEKPAVTTEVTPSLQGLFAQTDRVRHPWSKEGEFNIAATYVNSNMGSGPMGGMGGFLGIRSGMPRLPSFKKKVVQKTPEEIEKEERRARREQDRQERREKKRREREEKQKGRESQTEESQREESERDEDSSKARKKAVFSSSESSGSSEEESEEEEAVSSDAGSDSSEEESSAVSSSSGDSSSEEDSDEDDEDESGSGSDAEVGSSDGESSSDQEGSEKEMKVANKSKRKESDSEVRRCQGDFLHVFILSQ